MAGLREHMALCNMRGTERAWCNAWDRASIWRCAKHVHGHERGTERSRCVHCIGLSEGGRGQVLPRDCDQCEKEGRPCSCGSAPLSSPLRSSLLFSALLLSSPLFSSLLQLSACPL
eukprot:2682635-Rhodomonas_salina.1